MPSPTPSHLLTTFSCPVRSCRPLLFGVLVSVLLMLGAPLATHAQSVFADSGGFRIGSEDGSYQLRIGGDAHADTRILLTEAPGTTTSFYMRRARVRLRATVQRRFSVQFMSNFGRGRAGLQDAFIDFRFGPNIALRAGKFKTPVGLEFLQSPNTMMHIERGYPTAFVPNRDIGFQLHGTTLSQRLEYAIGVFNGAPDGVSLDGDEGPAKDIIGRAFVEPWRGASDAPAHLNGLGVGIAATYGIERDRLPTYRTLHQSPLFSYRTAVRADGPRLRLVPQFYYHAGSLGLLGEYALSSQAVESSGTTETLRHHAWQVGASYLLTGESATYGSVAPRNAYDPEQSSWGAFEVSAKVQRFSFDDDAFPTFATPDSQVQHGTAVAAGITWYPVRNIRFMVVGERTMFGGNEAGEMRSAEHTIGTRVQVAY